MKPNSVDELGTYYPFIAVRDVIAGYEFPLGAYDPCAACKVVFDLHTAHTEKEAAGRVEIIREPRSDGVVLLRIDVRKHIGPPMDHVQTTTAEMECTADFLSTPSRWSFETDLTAESGESVDGMRLAGTLRVDGESILIEKGPHTRRIEKPAAYTTELGLFDAVERLPREAFGPIKFTLFDDFDVAKPDQKLAFRETLELGQVTLHGYSHTGFALEPRTYWCDDAGRLIFVIAGATVCMRAQSE